jgi:hypothetical protein
MFILLFSTLAFADEAVRVDPDILPPIWILDLMMWLNSIPTVGPVLKLIVEWAGALAVISTTLCGAAILSLKALNELLPKFGLADKAKLIDAKSQKVIYWLKYVSLFNAKLPSKTAGQIVAEKK